MGGIQPSTSIQSEWDTETVKQDVKPQNNYGERATLTAQTETAELVHYAVICLTRCGDCSFRSLKRISIMTS